MKRLLLFFLLVLFAKFLLAQRREIEFVINPITAIKLENTREIQMSLHYKYLPYLQYLPYKRPFILITGIDYLKNHNNMSRFEMHKLAIPFILNFSIGNHYRFYGGAGLYGSFNLKQENDGRMKSTIFQIGNCFNLGCQLRIKKQFYLNAEFKLFRDKSATYIDITSNPYYDDYMEYYSINFGCTYRLPTKKNPQNN